MEPFIRGLFAQVPDDEEGARYRVLAYVQRVKQGFGQRKLYPYLPELRSAQHDLEDLFRRREELGALMPGDLIGWDGGTGRALRTRTDDPLWQVLDQVYAVAQPLLERTAEEGTGLRQDLLGHIRVEPVGVLPLRMVARPDPRRRWLRWAGAPSSCSPRCTAATARARRPRAT